MLKRISNHLLGSLLAAALALMAGCSGSSKDAVSSAADFRVAVTLADSVRQQAITGRLFLLIHDSPQPTPREVALGTFAAAAENPAWGHYAPLFGTDVEGLQPGAVAHMDNGNVQGYPFNDFSEIPAGYYYAQAVFNVYTQFHRADGHTIWAAMDDWEGQQFQISPGNLYSEVKKIHIDPDKGFDLQLTLSELIPPIPEPPETKFTKRLKFKSELVSAFWGHDMYLGAVVQLPKSYYDNPNARYPVLYAQGHFDEHDRFVIPEERPVIPDDADPLRKRRLASQQRMYDGWTAGDVPQIIAVTFQHPTPYYDDSYAVNSANSGPYGDAIMQELIPRIEERFCIIREPWARVLTGGSTGGWISAALQIYYPKFFGGTWSFCPDPIDFRYFQLVNIYEDENAFWVPGQKWVKTERPMSRSVEGMPLNTIRRLSQLGRALGSHCRSAEVADTWNSVYSPVGEDGYPVPLWDHETGEISREVANYWHDHNYDLRYYLEQNWSTLGKDLQGKLHFACGDMDQFYLNLAMYEMEAFLEKTENPFYDGWFKYGRPKKGHGFSGYDSFIDLMREMLDHIAKNAPEGTDTSAWRPR